MNVIHSKELMTKDLKVLTLESESMEHGKGIHLGKWPSFNQFKFKPYEEKIRIYVVAKNLWVSLANCGFELSETYDQYINRITKELGV